MIPLCTPDIGERERAYINACVDSTFVSSVGPFVGQFEECVAEAAGATYAVATSAGTTGLHVGLVAAGVVPGDLVIVPSYSFIASANAVAHCCAIPWLFDIESEAWTLDPDVMERALSAETRPGRDGFPFHSESGRRVAAVLPVHTLGLPADMERIVPLARRFGLSVVADGAAALGAAQNGRRIGEMGADLTVLSFNGNKTITTGGGGAVVGEDEALLEQVRHLTTTARIGPAYHHDQVGFNYRMTNVAAALGCAQMERWQAFVGAKRRIADRYRQELGDLDGVRGFPEPEGRVSACWMSGVVMNRAAEKLLPFLRDHDIEVRPFWKPLHLQPPFANAPRTPMPVAEGIWDRVLPLPCSTHLGEKEQDQVIKAFRSVWKGVVHR
ncbi:MAG: DegT/DnrJ/EryC1/StrS family aminotransferase [Nitrococcus sp.]|nr:DegT/DnrJ/EryC1/StrS family aminotransferase [Nitrococcus sp.]